MAKLTQAEVKAKADEWAGLQMKMRKAESAKIIELQPHLDKYDKVTAPIIELHDAKIGKLYEKATSIETEVLGWLNGVGKPVVLSGELAVAAVETQVGARVINVEKFFDLVKEKNAAFWGCVSVAIKKAEELIGKEKVDEISGKGSKLEASLRLK